MKDSPQKRNSGQRYRVILDQLEKKGYVTVQDFSEVLGVSEVTIRKDLKELEGKKMLLRLVIFKVYKFCKKIFFT